MKNEYLVEILKNKSCVSGIFFRFFGDELQVFFQVVRYCRQMHHFIGLISSNSIKFYNEVVMGMPNRFYAIDRPRKKEQLPKVISLEEVQQIIENTNNMKHKSIVSLVFSAELRRGELLNLKLSDIDSHRMVINVIQGKGNKDRITILSPSVLVDLRTYL